MILQTELKFTEQAQQEQENVSYSCCFDEKIRQRVQKTLEKTYEKTDQS